ncbi:MAG: endo-1,4-beta-xylanase [Actinomycetes bacterium]
MVVLVVAFVALAGSSTLSRAHAVDASNTPMFPPLRVLAAPSGLSIGTAINTCALTQELAPPGCQLPDLSPGAEYPRVAASQFSSLSTESALAWKNTDDAPNVADACLPHPENYAFGEALVNFAHASGMVVRGTSVVWGKADTIPAWLPGCTASQRRILMDAHVVQMVSHFAGRVQQWDVVNEAICPGPDAAHGCTAGGDVKDTTFSQAFQGQCVGTKWAFWQPITTDDTDTSSCYINLAFELAHRADPSAALYYNDTDLWQNSAQFQSVQKLIRNLKADPLLKDAVIGVGMQIHLLNGRLYTGNYDASPGPSLYSIKAAMSAFTGENVNVAVTELNDFLSPNFASASEADQANAYGDALEACFAVGVARVGAPSAVPNQVPVAGCTSYTSWCFTDRVSFVPPNYADAGGKDGCMLDANYNPKPAYLKIKGILTAHLTNVGTAASDAGLREGT